MSYRVAALLLLNLALLPAFAGCTIGQRSGSGSPPAEITTIRMGGGHTCAVTVDAAGYCWGTHEMGELGIGRAPEMCAVTLYLERVESTVPSPPLPDTVGAYAPYRLTRPPLLLNRLEVLHAYRRLYPLALLQTNTGGQTVVQTVIDEAGVPIHAGVVSSSHLGFNTAAIDLAHGVRFRPGLCGEQRVRVRLELPIGWAPEVARRPPPESLPPEPQDPPPSLWGQSSHGILCTR